MDAACGITPYPPGHSPYGVQSTPVKVETGGTGVKITRDGIRREEWDSLSKKDAGNLHGLSTPYTIGVRGSKEYGVNP